MVWRRIMRNDNFPPNYIGQTYGQPNNAAWHIVDLGPDQGYGPSNQVIFVGDWPWFFSENYNPW